MCMVGVTRGRAMLYMCMNNASLMTLYQTKHNLNVILASYTNTNTNVYMYMYQLLTCNNRSIPSRSCD